MTAPAKPISLAKRVLALLMESPRTPHAAAAILGVSKKQVSGALTCLSNQGCARWEAQRRGGNLWYFVAEPRPACRPRIGQERPREIRIRRGSSSGVVTPAPYHRGSFWGAGLV